MKINKKLNLVLSIFEPGVFEPDGKTPVVRAYVHSMPITTEAFRPFKILSGQTMNALYTKGLGLFAARHAADMLKDVIADNSNGDEAAEQRESQRVEKGLLNEIRRMTNVILLGDKGWETLGLHDAQQTGALTAEEAEEIEGALVFFTFGSHTHTQSQQNVVLGGLGSWRAQTTSLNSTEFMKSLPTLMRAASTGEKAAA